MAIIILNIVFCKTPWRWFKHACLDFQQNRNIQCYWCIV